jgi:hypothetical protein
MIKDTTVVNAGRKDITDLEIKKPYTLFQCSKFIKGIDRADKFIHHRLDSPWWVLAFLRTFAHLSLSRATFFQFLTPNILIS